MWCKSRATAADVRLTQLGVAVQLLEPVRLRHQLPDPLAQILTIAELPEQGRKPQIPLVDPGAFRKPAKEDASRDRQVKLL